MNCPMTFRVNQLNDATPCCDVDLRAVITTVLFVACLCMGSVSYAGETRAALSDAPDGAAEQINFERGLLSIAAQRAPWRRVLERIAEKTGIRFRSAAPLAGSVSVSIEPLPVRQALERLLGPGAGFICRYERATDSGAIDALPAEVWILGGERFARSEARSNDRDHSSGETNYTIFDVGAVPDQAGTVDVPPGTAEGAEIDALLELAAADDPALRVQALSALGDRGAAHDDSVRSTLEAALADRDAGVRGQALQALAIRGGGEAMKYLKQGLADPDPGVRMVVVERVEPKAGGIALLQEALADADEAVRSLAAARLEGAEQ